MTELNPCRWRSLDEMWAWSARVRGLRRRAVAGTCGVLCRPLLLPGHYVPGEGPRCLPLPLACVHRGGPTGETRPCLTCTGELQVPVLACALHAACTRDKLVPGLACCLIWQGTPTTSNPVTAGVTPSMTELRNRIKAHRRGALGDLVPHELNPRTHSRGPARGPGRALREIGFARSPAGLRAARWPAQADRRPSARGPRPRTWKSTSRCWTSATPRPARCCCRIDPLAQLADYDTGALDELRQTDQHRLGRARQPVASIAQPKRRRRGIARRDGAAPPAPTNHARAVPRPRSSARDEARAGCKARAGATSRTEGLKCQARFESP